MAAWGLLILESGLHSAGTYIEATGHKALSAQIPIAGLISLERGFIFTSMIMAALTVSLVEKHYLATAAWAFTAAVISSTGLDARLQDYRWGNCQCLWFLLYMALLPRISQHHRHIPYPLVLAAE